VIDPKAFLGYLTRVLQFNSIFLAMNNTPHITYMKNDLAHGVLQNTPIGVLISL
jgi:hypothetical protein